MLGDNINGRCGCDCQPCTCKPQPYVPKKENEECGEWTSLYDTFWTGDPISNTPIKKGTRGTEVILYLLSEIKDLDNRVTELEG